MSLSSFQVGVSCAMAFFAFGAAVACAAAGDKFGFVWVSTSALYLGLAYAIY